MVHICGFVPLTLTTKFAQTTPTAASQPKLMKITLPFFHLCSSRAWCGSILMRYFSLSGFVPACITARNNFFRDSLQKASVMQPHPCLCLLQWHSTVSTEGYDSLYFALSPVPKHFWPWILLGPQEEVLLLPPEGFSRKILQIMLATRVYTHRMFTIL